MLTEKQLLHIHKVLWADIKECNILANGRTNKFKERIELNKSVMNAISAMLGYTPEWKLSKELTTRIEHAISPKS